MTNHLHCAVADVVVVVDVVDAVAAVEAVAHAYYESTPRVFVCVVIVSGASDVVVVVVDDAVNVVVDAIAVVAPYY